MLFQHITVKRLLKTWKEQGLLRKERSAKETKAFLMMASFLGAIR